MNRAREWMKRMAGLFHKERRDAELAEELASHLEMLVEQNVERGMTPEEARRAARIALGGGEQIKEAVREQRGLPWIESFIADVRFGLRMLRKSPGFTCVAILTLALGIGANAAIFSVLDAVVLRALPYNNPDRLVLVKERIPTFNFPAMTVCAADVPVFQQENRTFEALSAFRFRQADFSGRHEPRRVNADRVNANLLSLLGVHPILGREFTPEEDRPQSRVAMLSYSMWLDQFDGNPDAIGQTVELDREPYTVIGVLPAGFDFPLPGMNQGKPADLFVPMGFTPEEMSDVGDNFSFSLLGRMRAGVTVAAANADIDSIAAKITETYPPQYRTSIQLRAVALPLRQEILGGVQTPLFLLFGAVGFVLLIACANVANLLLARATNRQKEFAVRLALGAGRMRLARQLLSESMLLAGLGTVAGLGLGAWITPVLAGLLPTNIPRIHPIEFNWAVVVFTSALAVFAAITFGLAPALSASRTGLSAAMKESGHSAGNGRRHRTLRLTLATIEVALCVVLLAGTALLVASLVHVLDTQPGFEPQHVLTASLYLPPAQYKNDVQVRHFYATLLERLMQLPGVTAAGASTDLPIEGGWDHVFTAEGKNVAADHSLPFAFHSIILGNYLQTMGIRLLQGRYFNDGDTITRPPVLIVSESLAKRYWPGKSALGKRLKWGPAASTDPWMTIVGVVSDVKQRALDTATLPHTYEPYEQHRGAPNSLNVAIRTQGNPASAATSLRAAVWGLDRQLAVAQLRTMDEVIGESMSARRFNLSLIGAFTALAMALAIIGIYGVMGYSVAERTHEIGIRMALGATRGGVMARVIVEALVIAMSGIGIGLCGTVALARVLSGLLYGVSPTDPMTLVIVCATILGASIAASYIPARRAMAVDPMVALRHE